MQELLSKEDILEAYNKAILDHVGANGKLTVDSVIDLSLLLFNSIKVKDVDYSEKDNDMLLFQYGTYNWGDEKGDHSNFDITRQFRILDDDEFYQLSFSLIYDPSTLTNDDSYDSWSAYAETLEDWVANIRVTPGYQKLRLVNYRTYELDLSQT